MRASFLRGVAVAAVVILVGMTGVETASADPTPTGLMRGFVTDFQTHVFVADRCVDLVPQGSTAPIATTTTSAGGEFRFVLFAVGTFHVVARDCTHTPPIHDPRTSADYFVASDVFVSQVNLLRTIAYAAGGFTLDAVQNTAGGPAVPTPLCLTIPASGIQQPVALQTTTSSFTFATGLVPTSYTATVDDCAGAPDLYLPATRTFTVQPGTAIDAGEIVMTPGSGPAPAPVVGKPHAKGGVNEATITWPAVPGGADYVFVMSHPDERLAYVVGSTATSLTMRGLPKGKYRFSVYAIRGGTTGKHSQLSNRVTVRNPKPPRRG